MPAERLFIDLFAGCGGLSLGLQRAGWTSLFAVEAHRDAFGTYQRNHLCGDTRWPTWLPVGPSRVEELIADHRRELASLAGTVSLVTGGPPCQGFSTAGRRRADDPRNAMIRHYLDFLRLVQPEVVLLENVRGFTSMRLRSSETYAEFVMTELERLGYRVWSELLIASDWGVPQRRPRFFVIAARGSDLAGIDPFLRLRVCRTEFLSKRGLPTHREVTASEALDDLRTDAHELVPCLDGDMSGFLQIRYNPPPAPEGYLGLMRDRAFAPPTGLRLPRHSDATTSRFAEILRTCAPGRPLKIEDRKRLNMLKRSFTPLAHDQPSCTVTTLPDDILHYAEPRILTVRECARLQSFPDTFHFVGPYTTGGPQRSNSCPRYTQVGNAVPPLLAEALGEILLGLLDSSQVRTQGDEIIQMLGKVSPEFA
jgi:DNA (cytosine-5)-methyltransferase 1